MLKFLFLGLLAANAVLLAYQAGFLESLLPSGREPARMSRQLDADKIKLIAPDSPAAQPPVPVAVSDQALSCIEIGNFTAEEARRVEASLAPLNLNDRMTRIGVREVASHMVYIPPQGDRDGAEKKAGELRRLGIRDFYVIQDNSAFRWGISLGVFKSREMAQAHLANLNQKGVRTARISERSVSSSLIAIQLRNLDTETRSKVEALQSGQPKREVRDCPEPETPAAG
jgi:hypothetical protein